MTISLSSSNTTVASVPASVAIQTGATTATFTVAGLAPGSTTIAASMNGASAQSSLTVTAVNVNVAIAGLSLADSTVAEGSTSIGTVTLTAPAPSGGATIALTGSSSLIVPTTVGVNAGTTSATFSYVAKAGSGGTSATLTATYAGSSASASVSIAKPTTAVARLGVTGPTESETCEMSNGGKTLNCTFNASTSSAPGTIVSYDWTYSAGGVMFSQTTTSAVLTSPTVDCTLLPSPPPPGGAMSVPLTVTVRIHDDKGNVADAADPGARLLPMHTCGY
jgi:hypothetical protein